MIKHIDISVTQILGHSQREILLSACSKDYHFRFVESLAPKRLYMSICEVRFC